MFVNPSPSRFAMMSMSLAKFAMTFLRRFVTMFLKGSVLQPQDKSAMMWWSKFQDKPTRLNVRLSTLKSVANLEAVVMEINLVLVYPVNAMFF